MKCIRKGKGGGGRRRGERIGKRRKGEEGGYQKAQEGGKLTWGQKEVEDYESRPSVE